jgi:DNA polymerase III delta prime subunit
MELSAHAYVVRGSTETLEKVLLLLEETGINTKGNPDVFSRIYPSFSIDDARTLREKASLRSIGGKGRIFIIAAPTIASDAQNALLKTFEEPPAGARFFLIVPSPETLLPTLRSRMQILTWDPDSQVGARFQSSVEAKKFLTSTPETRLEMLKPFLEKGDDDKRDLAGTISFLTELESVLASKSKENETGLRAVYRARKYITDRGALAKTLLEQAALIIPKMV